MDCQTTENGLSEYLDDELPSGDRREVGLHLAECRECQTHLEQMHAVRRDLQRLPQAKVPADLTMRLRIEASRHRSLTPQPSAWGLFWMRINQFLRPLMVPACGGLLSSVVLFTIFADTLNWQLNLGNDVPLGIYTAVSVEDRSPFQFTGSDLLLQLTVSEKGSVTDFEVPNGNLSRDDLKKIGNWLLFTSFHPATRYGQPTSGKVLVSFHRINVKG
ncbi:MAG TPA: hypothetical protein DEQ47_10945 [Solibacterales bacterium]|nr:hypothetical protein [Bryobacterales bacterium]